MHAVVFDLDDTLFPESSFVLSGFRAVSQWADERLGIPSEESFRKLESLFLDDVRGNTFNIWLAQSGLPATTDLIEQVVDVYREHRPVIWPFPEVGKLLTQLKKGFRIGLVSDGYLDVQRRKFEALGIAPYFDAVVFSDEFGRDAWKPSTKPFDAVVQRLGVAGKSAVYVGDNPIKDFYGARMSGMKTIQVVGNGEYKAAQPPTLLHAPDFMIHKLAEIPRVLGRIVA